MLITCLSLISKTQIRTRGHQIAESCQSGPWEAMPKGRVELPTRGFSVGLITNQQVPSYLDLCH